MTTGAAQAPPGLAPHDILRLGHGVVEMLDQRALPGETVTVAFTEWPEVVDAIRDMVVRGAPAIGVAGAMGVALAAQRAAGAGLPAVKEEVARAATALREARPTAVNLAYAVDLQAERAAAHPGPADVRPPTSPPRRGSCTTTRSSAASAWAPTP